MVVFFLFFSDKRDDKRNGTSSKSSRKKSPEKDRSKSKEKTVISDSGEYDPGSVDKVRYLNVYLLNKLKKLTYCENEACIVYCLISESTEFNLRGIAKGWQYTCYFTGANHLKLVV